MKKEFCLLVESIDNPKILENLLTITKDYIEYYSILKQKSEVSL